MPNPTVLKNLKNIGRVDNIDDVASTNYTGVDDAVYTGIFNSLVESGKNPEEVKHFLHTEFYPYEGMGIEGLEPIQKIKQKVNEDLEMGNIDLIGDKRVDTADTLLPPNISKKDQAFIDFFSQEGLDYTAVQNYAKKLIDDGVYAPNKTGSPFQNALTQIGKIAKKYPDHPASKNYKALSNEAMIQGGKESNVKLTTEQRQKGQAASADVQRQTGVTRYERLYDHMINNNMTIGDAVADLYSKNNNGKIIPKGTKHDQVVGSFLRLEDTIKKTNPDLHKALDNEIKAYQLSEVINRQVKYGTKEYEMARRALANDLGIDVADIDRAHSVMKKRLDKLYTLLDEGKITRQDFERLRRPSYFLLKKQNAEHIKLEENLDIFLERKAFALENGNDFVAQKAQEGIDKIVARMDEIGVKSEMYDPVDKAIAIFGREPTKEDFLRYKDDRLTNDRGSFSFGGDTTQYNRQENPNEVQVAMAFPKGNPFKLKDPPDLTTDFGADTLKLPSSGAKNVNVAENVAPVNPNSIFFFKSDQILANAPMNKAQPQQWLNYLKKQGVSPTELDEFGLQNVIMNLGDYDPSTGKYNNVKPISKNDLLNVYKKEKPILTYKINQVEPFEKGIKDFRLFLGHTNRYNNQTDIEQIRELKNKPADLAGDNMRTKIGTILDTEYDSWDAMSKDIEFVINDTYKKFYGIDNVIKNGVGDEVVPFYSKSVLDKFKRLKDGEGFYMSKNDVRHGGAQFLKGGTNYIEVPFTFNPQKGSKRAAEPKYTYGDGHFANQDGNNPFMWFRASERVDESGRRILFIEEIQSDMHQQVQQKGSKYAARTDAPGQKDMAYLNDRKATLTTELEKVSDQIDKITNHTDPSAATILERLKTKRDFLRSNLEVINEQMAKVTKTDGFPEGPFKKSENQAKVAIKTAINLAQKEGFDGVAMVTGKAKNRGANATGANAKGNLGFYDNIASKAMKVTAKNLDLDFSATNIKDGDGNTYAKIPLITFDKATDTKPVEIYKKDGGYIHYPSFVDVVSPL